MEAQPSPALAVKTVERAEVDTTRPFRSVKEAVAIFGERLLATDAYSQKATAIIPRPTYSASPPKPIYAISASKPLYSAASSPRSFSSSSSHFNQDREDGIIILNSIRKLEAELEETRQEVILLKERESEREIAVASLNAELHKSMSKLAEIEAAKQRLAIEDRSSFVKSERWGESNKFEYLPSLAEALSIGDMEDSFGGRRKPKISKKKPIVPLIGDLFSKKKKVSGDFDDSLCTRPFYGTLT
ncbi:WEB family protein At1g75720 [Asparagus officinalis]|uniref:WEB family protein At1g75720 n=1 Tax=Asparagus officinalis TaxID=4686 RepID=UPI00098E8363|nr:WEB family protein At1g75720 [Asparagus officinalis]